MSWDGIDSVVGKTGLFMIRIASLFVLQRLKEECQTTRAISTTCRCELSLNPPPPQSKVPKEIHSILTEALGEHAPSYATIKNWVAQFKRGDFFTYDAPRPG